MGQSSFGSVFRLYFVRGVVEVGREDGEKRKERLRNEDGLGYFWLRQRSRVSDLFS